MAVLLPLILVGGAVAGALWAGLAGWMRVARGVPEVISTIMLNFVAAELLSYLVHGPMQQASKELPASEPLPPAATLPTLIPMTSLTWGFVLALVAVIIVAIYLYRDQGGICCACGGSQPRCRACSRYPGRTDT